MLVTLLAFQNGITTQALSAQSSFRVRSSLGPQTNVASLATVLHTEVKANANDLPISSLLAIAHTEVKLRANDLPLVSLSTFLHTEVKARGAESPTAQLAGVAHTEVKAVPNNLSKTNLAAKLPTQVKSPSLAVASSFLNTNVILPFITRMRGVYTYIPQFAFGRAQDQAAQIVSSSAVAYNPTLSSDIGGLEGIASSSATTNTQSSDTIPVIGKATDV